MTEELELKTPEHVLTNHLQEIDKQLENLYIERSDIEKEKKKLGRRATKNKQAIEQAEAQAEEYESVLRKLFDKPYDALADDPALD